jgi:predicted TPR repeat methyltransferase
VSKVTTGKHDGPLGAVYGASGPEEIAKLYDDWAGNYDADMARTGYRHPSVALALLARHLPKGAAPLLDAGVGTGMIGDWLGILGYPEVEGLDISEGMLAVAAKKGTYKALHRLALGGPLPFADGRFAGIVSTGVFTTGHVGAEALDELIRVLAPGGIFVLTVKSTVWEAGMQAGLAARADSLAIAEQTEPYNSMPGEAEAVPAVALALRRL